MNENVFSAGFKSMKLHLKVKQKVFALAVCGFYLTVKKGNHSCGNPKNRKKQQIVG
jgi:hypothetical protein